MTAPTATLEHREAERQGAQARLEARSTALERNRLGQFATPPALALDILECACRMLPDGSRVRFLEPSIGTGAFFSALLRVFGEDRVERARGIEIDPLYLAEAARLWRGTPLKLDKADFTCVEPPTREEEKANLLIANPPYVRHHHVSGEDKVRLQALVQSRLGLELSGLTGLYGYFLLMADAWLARDGLAAWLIPSEFMDVNYGRKLKAYLTDRVTLLRVHRFDPGDVQFNDALVSSAVVWFRQGESPVGHAALFSFGGSLLEPVTSKYIPLETLRNEPKWTRFPVGDEQLQPERGGVKLADLFTISRGLATGANNFFILTAQQAMQHDLPARFLTPILPGPRHLAVGEVLADETGQPQLEPRLYLLDCDLLPDHIRVEFPSLWRYLEMGRAAKVDQGYLCRSRKLWYMQEKRPAPPFVCTYMGRQRGQDVQPFRFILNRSQATAANSYLLLYPKTRLQNAFRNHPYLLGAILKALNGISSNDLKLEGRVYGGGLHKLEPKELANVPADAILRIIEGTETDGV